MAGKRKRLDLLITELGLTESRSKAQALILEGRVFVNDHKIEKAGTPVDIESRIQIREPEKQWVSRGAYKLLKALEVFPVSPLNCICMDVGASTGGFTEVLLAKGATKVYSVDVGYGQLAWKLRQDPRVIVMERRNARHLETSDFAEKMDIITIDASFISLKLLLPSLADFLKPDGNIIALLKPQFEAGKTRIGRKGVVREGNIQKEIIIELDTFIRSDTKLGLRAIDYSPIKGPKGNIEFLLFLSPGKAMNRDLDPIDLTRIVDAAHVKLNGKGTE